MKLLEIEGLSISFKQYTKLWKKTQIEVISDLTLSVHAGEIVAIVGASGSGKSLLAHDILGILPENAISKGKIRYKGNVLTKSDKKRLRGHDIALIPQSVSYLDPLIRVGKQVRYSSKGKQAINEQRAIFKQYGLRKETEKLYPFELSGGMSRRVLLSTAMLTKVKLIVADEPTPGLDKKVMTEVLHHFKEFSRLGAGVILITHDIEAALSIADRIAVFYEGETVEVTDASNFEGEGHRLKHPFTKQLWLSLPQNKFTDIM
ncbi:MAG: ATP-binding cassette domain-containing protein [Vagococcus sp.]